LLCFIDVTALGRQYDGASWSSHGGKVPQHHVIIVHVLDYLRAEHQVEAPIKFLGNRSAQVLLTKLDRDSRAINRDISCDVHAVQLSGRESSRYYGQQRPIAAAAIENPGRASSNLSNLFNNQVISKAIARVIVV
jgi:hypothetical protein